MKIFRLFVFASFIFLPELLLSQGSQTVEMADAFRRDGKIYVVVLGLVIILTGVVIFLVRVDRKIFRLEKRILKEK